MQLEQTLARLAASPQPVQQQPAPQYQPAYQSAPAPIKFDPYADDFSDRMQAYTQDTAQRAIAQVAPAILAPLSQMARSNSRANTEFRDVWDRYGAEIDALMAPLAPELKANVDAWDRAAAMVRGNHYRELARAEAERLQTAPPSATERTQSQAPAAPASAFADEIEKFWQGGSEYAQSMRDNGTQSRDLYEAARKLGRSVEEYGKMLQDRALKGVPRAAFMGTPRTPATV